MISHLGPLVQGEVEYRNLSEKELALCTRAAMPAGLRLKEADRGPGGGPAQEGPPLPGSPHPPGRPRLHPSPRGAAPMRFLGSFSCDLPIKQVCRLLCRLQTLDAKAAWSAVLSVAGCCAANTSGLGVCEGLRAVAQKGIISDAHTGIHTEALSTPVGQTLPTTEMLVCACRAL